MIRLLPMELINVATKGGGGGGVVKCAFRGALLLHPPQFCCSTRLEAIRGKRVELSGASSRYGALIISQRQQQAPRNQTCSGFKLQEAQGVDDEEFGHGNVLGVAEEMMATEEEVVVVMMMIGAAAAAATVEVAMTNSLNSLLVYWLGTCFPASQILKKLLTRALFAKKLIIFVSSL